MTYPSTRLNLEMVAPAKGIISYMPVPSRTVQHINIMTGYVTEGNT